MLLAAVLLLLIAFLFHHLYWKGRHLPPGPTPLPLIGNMISLARNPPGFEAYQKWKETFGNIYTYWLGNIPIVTVNDYETIQEMFVKDADNYVDRAPFGDLSDVLRGGNYGINDASGPLWREQRRFALHALRDIGLGKARMQQRILQEAEFLMVQLEEEAKGGSVVLNKHLDRTVGSVINLVVFGFRFDETNAHEFYELRRGFDKFQKKLQSPTVIGTMTIPWLRNVPFIKKDFDEMLGAQEQLLDFFRRSIREHKESIDYSHDDAEDLTEAFLKEQHRQKDDLDTTFTEKQLEFLCLDLWTAGLETTVGTMAWGTLHLLHNPEIPRLMQNEFDRVIGSDRQITVVDKPNLPYTSAVISECQRWVNIVSQNFLRKSQREVVVGGHTILAGSPVSPQISMLLYDPTVYPDPEKFDPQRFLDGEGNYAPHKQFLPFSVGKRACPGEGLAKMELFLFFSNLINRFEISPDPNEPLHTLKRTFTTADKPEPFKCILTKRTF